MQNCGSRYCQLNIGYAKRQIKQPILCPFCKIQTYCSQRCRDLDWTQGHKNVCIPTQMLASQEIANSDKASTLRQMKRTPDDFEQVQHNFLGQGSFGAVKLVRDKSNGQLFAMKMISKKDIFEYCSIDNLKREIRIQRKLQHPNITQLYHYFEDKDRVYLVLEYAQKGSLFQLLKKRGRLSEWEAQPLFQQTCLGIEYLHQQGIIHRDLKPENILLDSSDTVKICDFGWSAENFNPKRSTFCGTIDYMAPEMIEDRPHDQTLDIWCLGILLYELLHGTAPYKGKNEIDKCNNIVKQQQIIYDNSLSWEARSLIQGMLKYKQSERLTIQQILKHSWLNKSQMEPRRKTAPNINEYKMSQSTTFSNPSYPIESDYRVSRMSRKSFIEIQTERERPKLSFIDKLLIALGCMKRENPQ